MNSAKPRRWFQLHLSTGIVLMFVAGGLMWLNNVPEMMKKIPLDPENMSLGYSNSKLPEVGWPIEAHEYSVDRDMEKGVLYEFYVYNFRNYRKYLIYDFLVSISILCATTFLLEWRIRRKTFQTEPVPQ